MHMVPINIPQIFIDDVLIHNVHRSNIRFLGVTIFIGVFMFSIISKSVARSVGILSTCTLKYTFYSNILKFIYNTIILPYLSYCHIWGNSYATRQ